MVVRYSFIDATGGELEDLLLRLTFEDYPDCADVLEMWRQIDRYYDVVFHNRQEQF